MATEHVGENDLLMIIKELHQMKNEISLLKIRIHRLEDGQGVKDHMGSEEKYTKYDLGSFRHFAPFWSFWKTVY